MEITRQADYYGLPEPSREPIPTPEKVADLLARPTPWQGPTKVAKPSALEENPDPFGIGTQTYPSEHHHKKHDDWLVDPSKEHYWGDM